MTQQLQLSYPNEPNPEEFTRRRLTSKQSKRAAQALIRDYVHWLAEKQGTKSRKQKLFAAARVSKVRRVIVEVKEEADVVEMEAV